VASGSVKFSIRVPVDEAGYRVVKTKDKGRFLAARNGDHLMTKLQCSLCHFRNIHWQNPRNNYAFDSFIMEVYLLRGILDGFWSRESSTINASRYEFEKLIRFHVKFGMERALPKLGPKPLADSAGMSYAISFLDRAQDRGRIKKPCSTVRQGACVQHTLICGMSQCVEKMKPWR
jgi:hypothetical protein